jgi:hypothetical protein
VRSSAIDGVPRIRAHPTGSLDSIPTNLVSRGDPDASGFVSFGFELHQLERLNLPSTIRVLHRTSQGLEREHEVLVLPPITDMQVGNESPRVLVLQAYVLKLNGYRSARVDLWRDGVSLSPKRTEFALGVISAAQDELGDVTLADIERTGITVFEALLLGRCTFDSDVSAQQLRVRLTVQDGSGRDMVADWPR